MGKKGKKSGGTPHHEEQMKEELKSEDLDDKVKVEEEMESENFNQVKVKKRKSGSFEDEGKKKEMESENLNQVKVKKRKKSGSFEDEGKKKEMESEDLEVKVKKGKKSESHEDEGKRKEIKLEDLEVKVKKGKKSESHEDEGKKQEIKLEDNEVKVKKKRKSENHEDERKRKEIKLEDLEDKIKTEVEVENHLETANGEKDHLGYDDKLHFVSVIAQPMAPKKLAGKIYRLIKKASKHKTYLRNGLKDVQNKIKKGETGIVIFAGDVSPIEVMCHLPAVCEEKELPYIYTPSRQDLGSAMGVKRGSLIVLIRENTEYENLYNKVLTEIKMFPKMF